MIQKIAQFSFLLAFISLMTACTGHKQALEVLPNELNQLNQECKRSSIKFEMDCYDLIASKNTFAQLRLGIYAQSLGQVDVAFERYTKAQKSGNFYANALLSNLSLHLLILFLLWSVFL